MSAEYGADTVLALRRLRRHLTFWRLTALVGFALALYLGVSGDDVLPAEDHIARIAVEGIIIKDQEQLALIEDVADDASVKALIVEVSSPGGTFTGGEAMMLALRSVAERKPVVAVMGDVATSGAYMTAIGADRIFASRGTLTGSIGVIMQSANITGLLDKVGVRPETIKSGPSKAVPNPVEDLTPVARGQLQEIIDELHLRFMEMVAERRNLSVDQIRNVAGDGRVMTGSRAVSDGLVDQIGGEQEARAWLASEHGLAADLPVITWELEDPLQWWRENANAVISTLFGKSVISESLRLDGIQALWHPSLTEGQ